MNISTAITSLAALNSTIPYQIKDTSSLSVTDSSDSSKLHTARILISGWRDRLVGKQRLNKRHSTRPCYPTEHRASVIDALHTAYTSIAVELNKRGEL